MDMGCFLDRARKIVLAAGDKARNREFGCTKIRSKPFDEIVTSADEGVDDFVVGELEREFPGHNIDSEERGRKDKGSIYTWMLDPIDGSRYYAVNLPFYSVSLALKAKKEWVLGVVYAPELDRIYSALVGAGATLNGSPISVGHQENLGEALIYLEIPSKHSPSGQLRRAIDQMTMLVSSAYRVRILGVGSLGLCFCAAGGFDAYVNLGSAVKPCDVAAGRVILREAGGEYSSESDKEGLIVAGSKGLCAEIKNLLEL